MNEAAALTRLNVLSFRIDVCGEPAARRRQGLLPQSLADDAASPGPGPADLKLIWCDRLPDDWQSAPEHERGADCLMRTADRTLFLVVPPDCLPLSERRRRSLRTIFYVLGRLAEHRDDLHQTSFILLLHASCVVSAQGALLFTGHSGFGKSTLSDLLSTAFRKVDDDLVLVYLHRHAHGYTVRALDCAAMAETGSPLRLQRVAPPVNGLFWLRKGSDCALGDLAPAQAAAGLLPPLFCGANAPAARRRLTMLREVLQTVPCRELTFPPDRDAVTAFLTRHRYLPPAAPDPDRGS